MKNSFLTKYNIVELLGLNFDAIERRKYLEEVSDTCVKKAFYRLYREGLIEEELFNEIEPIVTSDDKEYDITEKLEHLKEELDEAILIETNDYKKLSLIEQIEDFRSYADKKNIDDQEIYIVLPKLLKSLNNSGENFEELLNKYKKLKLQHGYESKV